MVWKNTCRGHAVIQVINVTVFENNEQLIRKINPDVRIFNDNIKSSIELKKSGRLELLFDDILRRSFKSQGDFFARVAP